MRIAYASLFNEQLAAIVDFIARDKPQAARRWVAKLFLRMERIAKFPRSGARLQRVLGEEVRQFWLGNYRVIYRVERTRIVGLSLSHGSRRIRPGEIGLLGGEEE